LFARPEAYPICYRFNSNADGAMLCFTFAGVVFAARHTVPMNVDCLANEKIIATPKENTGKPQKAKKITVKPKIVVGTV
jgi:hypothetical protein